MGSREQSFALELPGKFKRRLGIGVAGGGKASLWKSRPAWEEFNRGAIRIGIPCGLPAKLRFERKPQKGLKESEVQRAGAKLRFGNQNRRGKS